VDKANAVVLLALIFILVIWFYGPWQSLCVDWARERMFAARNAIFDMAMEGRLDFQSPEYRQLRYYIEGNIRFCHRISWPTLVILSASVRRVSTPNIKSMSELVATFPNEDDRKAIRRQTDDIAWTIVRLLVFRSAALLLLYAITWVVWKCGVPLYHFCKSAAESLVEIVQLDALAYDRKTPLTEGGLGNENKVSA